MDNLSTAAVILWIMTAIVTLLVLWFIGRGQLAVGPRLALMGCVVALAALSFGLFSNIHNNMAMPTMTSPLADTTLRLAAALALGGVVLMLLGRDPIKPTFTTPEADRNVPPSV